MITENDIEQIAIELLQEQGYGYLYGPDLLAQNEIIHKHITEGVDVSFRTKDGIKNDKVWLIDFNDISKNEFQAINQFTVIKNNINRRPDIVLFINGLPLVVIELKNPADEKADTKAAFNQIETYKKQIPVLFNYNLFSVISDYWFAKAGSISSPWSRFMEWKTKEVQNLLMAAEPQVQYLKKAHQAGDKRAGVVWRTQDSGKSLSMIFYTRKLVLAQEMNNPTIVVLTDRSDLDQQLFETFSNCHQLICQTPKQAESRTGLRDLLKAASGGVVFTTIQKFMPEEKGDTYPTLSHRHNIVVVADRLERKEKRTGRNTSSNKTITKKIQISTRRPTGSD